MNENTIGNARRGASNWRTLNKDRGTRKNVADMF